MNLDDPVMFYHLFRKTVEQQSQVYHQLTQLLGAFEKSLTSEQIAAYQEAKGTAIPQMTAELGEAVRARTEKIAQRIKTDKLSVPGTPVAPPPAALTPTEVEDYAGKMSAEALARLGIETEPEAVVSYLRGRVNAQGLAQQTRTVSPQAGDVVTSNTPTATTKEEDTSGPGQPRTLTLPAAATESPEAPLVDEARETLFRVIRGRLFYPAGALARWFDASYYPGGKGSLKPSYLEGSAIREYPSNLFAAKPQHLINWPTGFYIAADGVTPQFLLSLPNYQIIWEIGQNADIHTIDTTILHKGSQHFHTWETLPRTEINPVLTDIERHLQQLANAA